MRYRTVLADPAWQYNDKLTMSDVKRGADAQYKSTMTTSEICDLAKVTPRTCSIADHEIEDDAFLWLWITNPFLLSHIGTLVCRAWGFKEKQLITWIKGRLVTKPTGVVSHLGIPELIPQLILRTGLGHYTRGCTEHMILATRGQPKIYVKDSGVNNLILAPEEDILDVEDTVMLASPTGHSRKPEASYELIEKVCPGPYLELFARQRRPGWDAWGNEL